MTAPGMARRREEIRRRGGKVILIDPRQNETARLASEHIFIRPGTDVLLLLALLHVVFDENLHGSAIDRTSAFDRRVHAPSNGHVSAKQNFLCHFERREAKSRNLLIFSLPVRTLRPKS